jgi:hypothetical protein
MQCVVMLNVVYASRHISMAMLSAVMVSVIMPSVVAPTICLCQQAIPFS